MAKFVKRSKQPPTPYRESHSSQAEAQLARLDERLGVGVGAHKERTKLNRLLLGINYGK